jgi:hypothetical protein
MRLAQTEMARAYNEGAWRYMQEKKWIDGGIWRTVHFTPCPECEALEGRFFPKDDMPSMPLHPWCYCDWEMHIRGEPIAEKPPLPDEVKQHLAMAPQRQKRGKTPADVRKPPKPTRLADLKTTEQMQAWAEVNYPHMKWDLAGGDPAAIKPMLTQWQILAKNHPNEAATLKAIRLGNTNKVAGVTLSGPKPVARYMALDKEIRLDVNRYSDHYYLQAGLDDAIGLQSVPGHAGLYSWSPQGTNKIGATLTHEFGHHFDDYHRAQKTTGWRHVRRFDADIRVSIYSLENEAEKLAETFAATYYGPAATRDIPIVHVMRQFLGLK